MDKIFFPIGSRMDHSEKCNEGSLDHSEKYIELRQLVRTNCVKYYYQINRLSLEKCLNFVNWLKSINYLESICAKSVI